MADEDKMHSRGETNSQRRRRRRRRRETVTLRKSINSIIIVFVPRRHVLDSSAFPSILLQLPWRGGQAWSHFPLFSRMLSYYYLSLVINNVANRILAPPLYYHWHSRALLLVWNYVADYMFGRVSRKWVNWLHKQMPRYALPPIHRFTNCSRIFVI